MKLKLLEKYLTLRDRSYFKKKIPEPGTAGNDRDGETGYAKRRIFENFPKRCLSRLTPLGIRSLRVG